MLRKQQSGVTPLRAGKPKAPRRGDIIEINFTPAAGREMREPHRALVISDDGYNNKFRLVVVLAITTVGTHARENHFAVSLMGSGLSTDGVIICDQPRSLDLDARQWRFLEKLSKPLFDEALTIVAQVIGVNPPD